MKVSTQLFLLLGILACIVLVPFYVGQLILIDMIQPIFPNVIVWIIGAMTLLALAFLGIVLITIISFIKPNND